MKKIIDYAVVRNTDRVVFTSEVKVMILDGWQPYGSMTVDNCFNQAMVRYESEAKEIQMLYALESVDMSI